MERENRKVLEIEKNWFSSQLSTNQSGAPNRLWSKGVPIWIPHKSNDHFEQISVLVMRFKNPISFILLCLEIVTLSHFQWQRPDLLIPYVSMKDSTMLDGYEPCAFIRHLCSIRKAPWWHLEKAAATPWPGVQRQHGWLNKRMDHLFLLFKDSSRSPNQSEKQEIHWNI